MKNLMHKILLVIVSLTVLIAAQFCFAESSAVLDAELNQFKQEISGDNWKTSSAFRQLQWSGISDIALFDMIEERLKTNYMDETKEGMELNSWMVRSLAFSGQEKYKAFFPFIYQSEAPKKLRKHAKIAARDISKCQAENSVITHNNHLATSLADLKLMRVLNMLNSTNDELANEGAGKVYEFYRHDIKVVSAVNDLLSATYANSPAGERINALSWMVRIIAESGFTQFKPTLETIIADTSANKKVQKYAIKYSTKL